MTPGAKAERNRFDAMLKHAQKQQMQREYKPLAKHANETLKTPDALSNTPRTFARDAREPWAGEAL